MRYRNNKVIAKGARSDLISLLALSFCSPSMFFHPLIYHRNIVINISKISKQISKRIIFAYFPKHEILFQNYGFRKFERFGKKGGEKR